MTDHDLAESSRLRQRQSSERRNLFSRLPAIYAASRTQGQRLLQQAGGLSTVEWRVLWDLTEAGPLSVRQLAELQQTDHSLLSRALPAIKAKGFVTIERSAMDGRQMIVTLTEKGRAAYDRASPTMQKRRDALKQQFTQAELAQLVGFLDRVETFLNLPIEDILTDTTEQEDA